MGTVDRRRARRHGDAGATADDDHQRGERDYPEEDIEDTEDIEEAVERTVTPGARANQLTDGRHRGDVLQPGLAPEVSILFGA